jgi:adenine phosphoribosyltransferase
VDDLRAHLRAAFRWLGDRDDPGYVADPTGWWRDPGLLAALGPALAALAPERPTLVMGPQSRGSLLGALTAQHLGVGLLEVRKERAPGADSDRWWTATTPPDYRDRHLEMGVRRRHLTAGERVLLVDDWIDTGGQVTACRAVVEQSGATWLGAAVIVDGLEDAVLRRRLAVRSLLRRREL